MISAHAALRSTSLILSSTLLAIAAEPLPLGTPLTGVQAPYGSSAAVNVSYGDVDGDGFVDLALGNILYWGSSTGWISSSTSQPFGSDSGRQLWIVPNTTGAGTDSKVRADLILVDTYSGNVGYLVKINATAPRTTVYISTDAKLTLTGLKGRPAVGDFGGTGLSDIAWIGTDQSTNSALRLATNVGTGFALSTLRDSTTIGDTNYAAVAGVDWTGAGTGALDLLLVKQDYVGQSPAHSYLNVFRHNVSTPTQYPNPLSLSNPLYLPEITTGNIHNGGDDRTDAVITSRSSVSETFAVFASGAIGTAPVVSKFNGTVSSCQAWIVPDVTGDGTDDIAFYGTNSLEAAYGGLIHGGTGIESDITTSGAVPIDRPIPRDAETLALLYSFGFAAYSATAHYRPIATTYAVNGTPWERHFVLADPSNYILWDTQALPILSPTITGALQDLSGSGAQAIVDPQISISFPTATGAITTISVTVSGVQVGDALSDTASLPAGTTVVDVPQSNGSMSRVYTGSMTTSEAAAVLVNIRLTAVGGGVQRTAFVVVGGVADIADVGDRADSYFSAKFQSATIANPVPVISFSSVTNANVGGTVIVQVSGGDGTYTVTAVGCSAFVGGSPNGTNVGATNLFVTPTRAGIITVTVTDSTGLSGILTFTASSLPSATEPAPVVTQSVGEATVFGAICPGTVGGVTSLRAAFGASDARRARGFTWNSETQAYRELPTEPNGGLLPTDGVFLATRVALGLNFSGPAMPPGSTIVLRAGWNFVGMGPVQLTSGTVVRTHSLSDDFTLTNLSGGTVALSAISQAYQWTGTAYATTATLQSGVGYWIDNVASPVGTILLTRKDSDVDGRAVVQSASFAGNVGSPPVPPNGDQQAQPASQGSCGSGSGIAVLLAGLMAFLKLGFRRK